MRRARPNQTTPSTELEEEIGTLEQEIAELHAAEHEHDSLVAALEAEIEARRAQLEAQEGRLTLTRNALAEHAQRLEDRRVDLNKALANEARQALEDAMAARETAGKEVAAAAEALLDRLADLDRAREVAHQAFANAAARGAAARRPLDAAVAQELDAEPEVMREAWSRLTVAVRQRIDAQFEDELVEAAARSPLGHAIGDLPGHLQELAKRRRQALLKATAPS